jgi:hypothetical protein
MEAFINSSGLLTILVCSLIYCFFGYRFFKSLLSLAGALIFGSVAWTLSIEYFSSDLVFCLPIAIVSALLGAWLFHKLFKIAAFLYGASAGLALSPGVLTLVATEAVWVKWAIPAGCALLGGLFLLISHRIVLIVMTAATGAIYFVLGIFKLLIDWQVLEKSSIEQPDNVQISLSLFCFAITFLSGLIYQLKDKKSLRSD